jgi:hypothetical protein
LFVGLSSAAAMRRGSGGWQKTPYLNINFAFPSATAKNRKVRRIAADSAGKRISAFPDAERRVDRYLPSFP